MGIQSLSWEYCDGKPFMFPLLHTPWDHSKMNPPYVPTFLNSSPL